MAVIARDVYEIIVKGGVETKDLLSAMNVLLEEDRKRWADVAKVLGSVESALKELGKSQEDVQQGLSETTSKLLSVDAASNLLIKSWSMVRKAGEALAKPIGLATSFETEIAAIDTISNRAGERFASNFLDISERLGIDAAQVARAGYEAVGSGVSEASLAQFTEISAELATAGRAEILPTLKLLTTAQNQFGLSIGGVQEAADILFAVTRDGTTTIPELAAELGDLIPLGKGAGQTFKEIGASIGALTKGGLSTSLAATQLKALATSFQADLPKIVSSLGELGVVTDAQAFKALSFVEKISLLSTAFKGNESAAFKALGRQEAVAAVFALGANNAEFLRSALVGVEQAAGQTDQAVARFQETSAQTAARLKESFNRQLIELGNQLLPRVNEVMTQLTEYIRANGDELVAKITGFADSLISFATFVVEHGEGILEFFGLLVGAKVVAGIASVTATVGGLSGALATGLAGASAVASTALAVLLSPITAIVAGLAAVAAGIYGVVTAYKQLTSTEIDLGGVANSLELDVRLAEAAVQRAQQRNQLVSGQGVLTNPADLNPATGQIGGPLAGSVASLQDTLALGIDAATSVVQGNLDALDRASAAQRQQVDEAGLRIEQSQAEYAEISAEVDRLQAEQLRGNLLVNQELTLAVNRQTELERTIGDLQRQGDEARTKAAELEVARARLSVTFQQEITGQVAGAFKTLGGQIGSPFASLLNSARGFLAGAKVPTTPKTTGGRRSTPDTGAADEAALVASAQRAADELLQVDAANAERRARLIQDDNERELRLLGLRQGQELQQAIKAGEDLVALLQVQGRDRAAVLAQQDKAALDVRAQADQDYRTQLARNQQAEALILAGTDEGAILALVNRQETELALVAGNLEAERALREVHERDMTLLIEQQSAARLAAVAGYADSVGGILTGLGDTMRAFGVESKLLAGVEILATAASLEAKAISAFAESGLSFASGNLLKGGAQLAAGIAAQAQVVRLVAKAASLGATGGRGGSGPGAGAGGGGQRRNPRLENSSGGDGKREAVTFVFQGPVYDSRREAESAFGRQALRGVRRLQDAPRGAPRARISEFES